MTPEALDALVVQRVRAAGTSFFWAMRLMEPRRRKAMYAIYAFSREVDDIADEPGEVAEKRRRLDEWRRDIARLYAGERPRLPFAQALAGPIRDFDLPKEDLLAVVEGCAMDAGDGLIRPRRAVLDLYCDHVACAVGRLSVRIFGEFRPRSLDVANHQGRALQLTNILRDVWSDAEMGRLYLPDELLAAHGIDSGNPREVLFHPELPAVCRDLARDARHHYAEARAAIADCSRRAMRPAVVMLDVYEAVFRRGERQGWRPQAYPIAVPATLKLWYAVRHGLF